MSRVIVRKAEYEYQSLKQTLYDILDSLGGKHIENNSLVLLKPNLLSPASPDTAMLTHPLIVRIISEYALEKGARVRLSDSPAMGSFEKVLKESGIKDALKGLDVEFKEFKTSRTIDMGEPFKKIEIAEDALNADTFINLPKLKTHGQMLLTLGVKNLFGCIVGLRKPEWHFRTGIDREMFASLLAGIHEILRPDITILDGILAMEGQGPGKSGTPRHVGVVMGSNDAVAMDMAVSGMLGLGKDQLLTVAAAGKLGSAPESLEIDGDLPLIKDFKMPEITPLVFGPQWSHSLLRRHLVQRPVAVEKLCKSCGDCLRYCPANAITREKSNISFDYNRCIRCYCCLEVCPHGALRAEEPFLGKIFSKIKKRMQ